MTRPPTTTTTIILAAWANHHYHNHAPLLFASPWCRMPNSDTRRTKPHSPEHLANLRLEAENLSLPWTLYAARGRKLIQIDTNSPTDRPRGVAHAG